MKYFCVFVLVSFCYSLPMEGRVTNLSAPHLSGLTTIGSSDNVGFIVTWDKVDSDDADDPIIGYKPIDVNNVPEGEPTIILIPANQTEATYNHIKLNVTYEVRVQAYTENIDGPLSDPFRLNVMDPKN